MVVSHDGTAGAAAIAPRENSEWLPELPLRLQKCPDASVLSEAPPAVAGLRLSQQLHEYNHERGSSPILQRSESRASDVAPPSMAIKALAIGILTYLDLLCVKLAIQ